MDTSGSQEDIDAPSYFDEDLNSETIEQVLESLTGYDDLGRVEIDRWPCNGDDASVVSPPRELEHEINTLRERYPDAIVELVMEPHQFDVSTNRISNDKLEAGAVADPGSKLLLIPVIKCHDCPDKLYIANPNAVLCDLSIHMRNRLHLHSLKLRLLMDSGAIGPELRKLYHAIKDRDLDHVRGTFVERPDLFRSTINQLSGPGGLLGYRLLLSAIKSGHHEILRTLFNHGFFPYTKDQNGRTLLHNACYLGNGDIVGLLIEKGLNPFHKDSRDVQPIDLAVMEGHTALALRLLHTKSDAHDQHLTEYHTTPLVRACDLNSLVLVKSLLEQGEYPDGNIFEQPLNIALQRSSPEILDCLLGSGARLNLVKDHHVRTIKGLIKTAPDLSYGPYARPAEKLNLLVKYGLDLNEIGSSSGSDRDSRISSSSGATPAYIATPSHQAPDAMSWSSKLPPHWSSFGSGDHSLQYSPPQFGPIDWDKLFGSFNQDTALPDSPSTSPLLTIPATPPWPEEALSYMHFDQANEQILKGLRDDGDVW